jgi:hypothetical protein
MDIEVIPTLSPTSISIMVVDNIMAVSAFPNLLLCFETLCVLASIIERLETFAELASVIIISTEDSYMSFEQCSQQIFRKHIRMHFFRTSPVYIH